MSVVDEMHRDPAAFAERVRREPALASFVDERGSTLLHHAVVHPAVTEALVAAGADPNRRDPSGNTPVHLAGKWCALQSLQALIAAGGDASTPDSDGKTPLDWAVERGRDDVARFLRGEPDFVYTPPPAAPPETVRFTSGVSIAATLIALFLAWIGFAAARAGLRSRSEIRELDTRGVVVTGTVADYLDDTVGINQRKSVWRPIVTYESGGRSYKRYTERAYLRELAPPKGSAVQVVHLPDRPEVARVKGIDPRQWVALTLFGWLAIVLPISLVILGTLRGHLFAR